MCLLKKNTLFFWDDQAQQDFDNLRYALTHSPMIHPLDYSKDFMLYIVSFPTTILMALA